MPKMPKSVQFRPETARTDPWPRAKRAFPYVSSRLSFCAGSGRINRWSDCEICGMTGKFIKIGGARQHNLKNLSLSIPRDQLVVITGLSGSGKSSLAFDTIYAEGQRKYVESLSSYARQFLGLMEKP